MEAEFPWVQTRTFSHASGSGSGIRFGAGSVIAQDVPVNTTAVGMPCRVVRDDRFNLYCVFMDSATYCHTMVFDDVSEVVTSLAK